MKKYVVYPLRLLFVDVAGYFVLVTYEQSMVIVEEYSAVIYFDQNTTLGCVNVGYYVLECGMNVN